MNSAATVPHSYINQTRLAYIFAFTLPFLCGYGSSHISLLSGIPFSLAFLTIVLVATLGGLLPALIAVSFCIVARIMWPIPGMPTLPLHRVDAQRAFFLVAVAVIIGAIGAGRRKTQLRLQHALREVNERNDALLESIAERKLAEAAVLRSEKLAAMGRLASTIAHEINNPLEAVTNLIYLARGEAGTSDTAQTYLEIAEKELARLSHITRLTLGFVRSSAEHSKVDVATAVEEVIFILHHRLQNSSIRIDRRFQPGVTVSMAPHELRQIITNLFTNAVDATSASGSSIAITIRKQDDKAVLLVEDNGEGIAPANLLRIFEPFFSTKTEVGTGIGLWVTREIAIKNGGTITAESGNLPDGMSTRFRVELPLVAVESAPVLLMAS